MTSHDNRVHTRFMMSMIALVNCGKFRVTISNVSQGGIHKARNSLAYQFLTKCDADLYLSLDTDISFDPGHVERLISHNKPVVWGPYCHKKPGLDWSCRAIEGKRPDPETRLQEMAAVGTGFLLVRREVFEKIRREHPEIAHIEDWAEHRGETKWDFFSEGIVTDEVFDKPTFLTEDFYFCKRCREAGFPIYADTGFYVMHWDGGRGYPEQPPGQEAPTQAPVTVRDKIAI
jgi:hypothetical protein